MSSVPLVKRVISGSEAGSYLRLTDFVYHSTLGLRVIKKEKKKKKKKKLGISSARNVERHTCEES